MTRLMTTTFALLLTTLAAHAQAPVKAANGVLTDAKGMTLYSFDKDAAGVSNCNDGCAAAWPPLTADAYAAADGDWTIIGRADGTKQWAYDGKPLYTFASDAAPGDTTGDGVKGVWHVLKAE
jgi:predicted lipoprotein with Yx(FWY)xxD motif